MAWKLGVSSEAIETDVLHWLPLKEAKRKVHRCQSYLYNRIKKPELVKQSKEKKLDGQFISDHLTTNTQKLFAEPCELSNKETVKFARCKVEKVLVRKYENNLGMRIKSL